MPISTLRGVWNYGKSPKIWKVTPFGPFWSIFTESKSVFCEIFHFLKRSRFLKFKNANIFEIFWFFLTFWLLNRRKGYFKPENMLLDWTWTPSRAELSIFYFQRQSGHKYVGKFAYFLVFRNLKFGRESRIWAIS